MARIARSGIVVGVVLVWMMIGTHRAGAFTIQFRNSDEVAITAQEPGGNPLTIDELSGVTYNPDTGTFWAVSDQRGTVIEIDVQFAVDGSIVSASAVGARDLGPALDYEGIAYTNAGRNSVFVSEEGGPGVSEFSLVDGSKLQDVAVPGVFSNQRGNRGFEALARHPDGSVMYTATEEALTVDGPASSTSAQTPARLLRYNVTGNTLTPAEEYIYPVDPIHSSANSSDRSGLVDLVVLPGGEVLALERSWNGSSSLLSASFESNIYLIDFTGATDVSQGDAADGILDDVAQSLAVGKDSLFVAAAPFGLANLEGLALGPQLSEDSFVLLGVVDDQGALGTNIIVSFELTLPEPIPEPQTVVALLLATVLLRHRRCRAS